MLSFNWLVVIPLILHLYTTWNCFFCMMCSKKSHSLYFSHKNFHFAQHNFLKRLALPHCFIIHFLHKSHVHTWVYFKTCLFCYIGLLTPVPTQHWFNFPPFYLFWNSCWVYVGLLIPGSSFLFLYEAFWVIFSNLFST